MTKNFRTALLPHQLNKDQLTEVAHLCFDLAKAAFVVAILPTINTTNHPITAILTTLLGIFWGLAFAYLGLLFLERKERLKK